MKYRFAILAALAVGALAFAPSATPAQGKAPVKKAASKAKVVVKKKAAPKAAGPENGLVGIKIYDNATDVLRMYGNPNVIEPIVMGGSATGPVGGGGAGPSMGGPGGGGGMPMGAPGGRGASPGGTQLQPPGVGGAMIGPDSGYNSVFGFGTEMLGGQEITTTPPNPLGNKGGMGPGNSTGGKSGGGMGPMPPSGGGGGMAAPGGGGASGPAVKVNFVRWIYNRPSSKYAFVMDKAGKVVQCEAIGISDPKVRTNRGVTFGSKFDTLVRTYGYPDGYEISGDSIVVRFMQRNKVGFKLTRLETGKPHVVTGVVVAGGKA